MNVLIPLPCFVGVATFLGDVNVRGSGGINFYIQIRVILFILGD